MGEEADKQLNNSKPWLYKKGQSGNPNGRPKGSKSMKTWIKEKLAVMNDEEREEFLESLPKSEIWRMAEGNPANDVTSDGKPLQIIVPPAVAKAFNINDNSHPETGGGDSQQESTQDS